MKIYKSMIETSKHEPNFIQRCETASTVLQSSTIVSRLIKQLESDGYSTVASSVRSAYKSYDRSSLLNIGMIIITKMT